jgi:hypothetical protein
MSLSIGGLPGAVEGLEAGIGTEALNQNGNKWRYRVLGAFATAAGIYAGHRFGSGLEELVEDSVGGGVGFLPAIAVGGMLSWHGLRTRRVDQMMQKGVERNDILNKVVENAPAVLVGAFAMWEGAEAGFITGSAGADALTTVVSTGVGYVGGITAMSALRRGSEKISVKNVVRNVRLAALTPPLVIGGLAVPELMEHTTPGSVALAVGGIAALSTALYTTVHEHAPSPIQEVQS